ncbi:SUKH-3 domain-containing protein [Aureivirga sp. CE67]|uniref:SUKH-3 domain-containing protein n=1 Tax=Aureivirga sp. CE67 TaxID=1788983 RepID=UPI0018CB1206|nr:SUKH-3 domain-containing protein [Aureivirga sp. CE67]
MKFRKGVDKMFRKAGWYPGRNVQKKFDKLKNFEKLPDFLKEFLYEYGDLRVKTMPVFGDDFVATWHLTFYLFKSINFKTYSNKYASYGNDLITYPLGYYDMDRSVVECDKDGRIYMVGETIVLLSDNFYEGLSKIICEDYSDILYWDFEKKSWVSYRV